MVEQCNRQNRQFENPKNCKVCKVENGDIAWAIDELTILLNRYFVQELPSGDYRGMFSFNSASSRLHRAYTRLLAHMLEHANPSLERLFPQVLSATSIRTRWCQRCGIDFENSNGVIRDLELVLNHYGIADVPGWRNGNTEETSVYRRIMRVVCGLRPYFAAHCTAFVVYTPPAREGDAGTTTNEDIISPDLAPVGGSVVENESLCVDEDDISDEEGCVVL